MLVQFGAIELRESKIIRRKVARHPVKDDVQARLMRGVHEITEIIARAKTTRWRIKSRWLITPTAVKRMLIHRQQFEMGKAHPFHVRDELVSQLAIAQPEVVVGMATP